MLLRRLAIIKKLFLLNNTIRYIAEQMTENQHIVLQTTDGFFLRFPAAEVTEKKKGAIGVRGIRLKKDDALTDVYLFEEGTECKISYHEKEVTLNRLKLAKRDGTGTKYRG